MIRRLRSIVPFAVRTSLCAALFMAALFLAPPAVRAEEPITPLSNDAPDFIEITPKTRASIEKGLRYLATLQGRDGSFGGRSGGQTVGITSLACLAFMADGNLPGRGEYAVQVERALDFILRSVQETGLITADAGSTPMYGHGFATLLLGEVYGMTGDRRVRDALVKAVRLIVATQNSEGGWRYQPVPLDADLSVTICQIMGLRSARNAGLSVPKETIDRAIVYVRQCQNREDGGFRYQLMIGGSMFPRSAAGVASLYYAGIYQDRALERGLDYLLRNKNEVAARGSHYFYGQYYAVQAMYLAGGKYWAQWYPMVRDEMVRQQQERGGWTGDQGEDYGTAMALLVLQAPNRFLPIFQR
ncbi:MAG: terpene cyclase/mutase family protein [Planctomycetota bacterium]|nr:terpene cyclase/mutase family protein [Planctomycetota bacterium]